MRTTKKEHQIYLIPIIILLTIHPLILRLYEYDNGLDAYAWAGQTESSMDLFLHGKMVFFEIICAACIFFILLHMFRNETEWKLSKIFLLPVGYAVLALASTFVSPYRTFGFSGIHEQFENIWCIMGYTLILLYINLLAHDFKHIHLLIYALLFGALLIGLIGTFQFIGHDLLVSEFFKNLYIPVSLKGTQVSLAFALGTVYMTLYNPDYVGLYTALVCPVLLVLCFYEEKKWSRILSGISFVLLVIGTIGANALGGYIGLGFALFVLFLFFMREFTGSKKKLLCAVVSAVVVILMATGIYMLHRSWERSPQDRVPVTTATQSVIPAETPTVLPSECKLDSIQEMDDYVEFCYDGVSFRESMSIRDGMVYLDFVRPDGNPIAYDYDAFSMVYTLTEPGLEGITSYSVNLDHTYIGFVTAIDGKEWTFTRTIKDDVMSYYMMNNLNELDKNITSESAVFTDHYELFSGRGYIWAKTIPLLKKYLFLGSGADSFTLVFPQSDYVSAYKGGYENMIVSKPHNLYLQIAVQTGVLSLLLLLVFYLWYTWKCMRLYFMKRIHTQEQAVALAVFAGTVGFLVVSLANDSTICVTPVFVALLGIGIALNRLNEATGTQPGKLLSKKEKQSS